MSSHEKLGKLAVGLALVSGFLVAVTVHGSMPRNAIDSGLDRELQTTAWAPESWRFFTRNPQEEQFVPFARQGDRWVQATRPSASPSYAFGLDRSGRAAGIELGLLLDGMPPSAFRACDDDQDPGECLDQTQKVMKLKNETPHPSICGPIGIVARKPVPWAWARSGKTINMPARVLRLEVEC